MQTPPSHARPGATGPRFKKLKRAAVGLALASLLAVAGLSAYTLYTIQDNNFHVVVAGRAYRSAQMDGDDLARCLARYGIKSILNLRGENSAANWYQTETATAAKWQVVHYDRRLDSGTELTLAEMQELVSLLRQAPQPVLIHCLGGADRSGLVSALYCFAVEGQTPEVANRQLTVWYGHAPLLRPKVRAMDRSFWRYVSNHVASAKPAAALPAVAVPCSTPPPPRKSAAWMREPGFGTTGGGAGLFKAMPP